MRTKTQLALPDHLARMCLFKVNTGCREQEVCGLRWEWEVQVPELKSSVFSIPGARVKNREDRLVVLNRVARSVIEEARGKHPEFVFLASSYRPQSTRCSSSATHSLMTNSIARRCC
jgi:integrase